MPQESAIRPPAGRLDGKSLLWLLLIFSGVFALWNTPVVWPLKIMVVFFHEFSHALATWLSGGSVEAIQLSADEGGLCLTRGGWPFLVLSAGYLGSMLLGALLLVVASRSRRDRLVVAVLGGALLCITLVWVPFANPFGFFFGLATGAAMLLTARFLPGAVSDGLLKLIGLTSLAYAPLDIWSDLIARDIPQSDANALGKLTGIPGVVFGVLWGLLALAGAIWALWRSARRGPSSDTGPAAGPVASP
ncbi:MAG: M50 family metallopeptidase [Myxococcales bacterium]|nr:M50 family metallopeptidase [Myxococcales bacterium]